MPGYSSGDPFAGGFGSGTGGILRDAGRQGFFTPGGSDRYRTGMRRRLMTQGRSRRNRASILARLAGLDSIGQRQAMVDTEQDIAGTTAGTLNDFDNSEFGNDRDYFRSLLGNERGFEEERRREKMERAQQWQQFLGGLGGVGGRGILSLLMGDK